MTICYDHPPLLLFPLLLLLFVAAGGVRNGAVAAAAVRRGAPFSKAFSGLPLHRVLILWYARAGSVLSEEAKRAFVHARSLTHSTQTDELRQCRRPLSESGGSKRPKARRLPHTYACRATTKPRTSSSIP